MKAVGLGPKRITTWPTAWWPSLFVGFLCITWTGTESPRRWRALGLTVMLLSLGLSAVGLLESARCSVCWGLAALLGDWVWNLQLFSHSQKILHLPAFSGKRFTILDFTMWFSQSSKELSTSWDPRCQTWPKRRHPATPTRRRRTGESLTRSGCEAASKGTQQWQF